MSESKQVGRPKKPTTEDQSLKIKWRGDNEFRHDLFKLGLAIMKKNHSYREGRPEISSVEHCHFFHSHDSKGSVKEFCMPSGGHFHAIEVTVGPEGGMVAKCGPPLRFVDRKFRGKLSRVKEQVKFNAGTPEDPDKCIYDNHVHEVKYQYSEIITPNKIQKQVELDKAKLERLAKALPPVTSKATPQTPLNPSGDGLVETTV